MAIKGLTDRGLSFPEIGSIRKGAKKTENRPGADLKYFRVEFDGEETETAAKFAALYKNTPSAIKIILPFNEIERCWDPYLEAYTAGRMVARSDGERYLYRQDLTTGKVTKDEPYVEGEPAGYDYKNNPVFCKPVGRLKVIIRELARAAYLTVHTTSIHDIMNISSQLAAFKEINGGRLAGIPLILRRRPKEISTPTANGGRARRVKYLISIEADPEWVERAMLSISTAAMPMLGGGETEIHALEPGEIVEIDDDIDEIEGEIMDDEPEAIDAEPEPIEQEPEDTRVMTLEFAQTVTTSKGTPYAELADEFLQQIVDDMTAKLEKNQLSIDENDRVLMKREAARVILTSRNQ